MPDAPAAVPLTALPLGPDSADLLWVGAKPADRRGRVVVEVVGEVDEYTAPLLASCLRGQSARSAVRTLVVDLSRVRFLSCAGLALLEEAAERCAARGARLVLRTGERRGALRALELGSPSLLVEDSSAGRARERGPSDAPLWRVPGSELATAVHHRPSSSAERAAQTAMISRRQASGSVTSRR